MGRESQKGAVELKRLNIPLDGPLHARAKRMAQRRRQSLTQLIVSLVDDGVGEWEATSLSAKPTDQGPGPAAPAHHKPRAPRLEGDQPSAGYSGTVPFRVDNGLSIIGSWVDTAAQIGEIDRLVEEIDRCSDRDAA